VTVATHHPECDGWIMDTPEVRREMIHGVELFTVYCGRCDETVGIGSHGLRSSAEASARRHDHGAEPCDGRCRAWSA
jgi:hypothetical protein